VYIFFDLGMFSCLCISLVVFWVFPKRATVYPTSNYYYKYETESSGPDADAKVGEHVGSALSNVGRGERKRENACAGRQMHAHIRVVLTVEEVRIHSAWLRICIRPPLEIALLM
jgi:hypothetical protein